MRKRAWPTNKYNEMLYKHLEDMSEYDEVDNVKYLEREQIKFIKIAENFPMDRKTISKRFQTFMQDGTVVYNVRKERYELINAREGLSQFLSKDAVRFCCNVFNSKSLNALLFLFRAWDRYKHPFVIDVNTLCNYSYRENWVDECLAILQQVGFFTFHKETTENGIDIYILDSVNFDFKVDDDD